MSGTSWFALSVSGFNVDPFGCYSGYTILRLPELQTPRLGTDIESTSVVVGEEEDEAALGMKPLRRYMAWEHVGAIGESA